MTIGYNNTDIPAYSDTGYSDTPLTVTLLAIPKPFYNKIYLVTLTNTIKYLLTVTLLLSILLEKLLFWPLFCKI